MTRIDALLSIVATPAIACACTSEAPYSSVTGAEQASMPTSIPKPSASSPARTAPEPTTSYSESSPTFIAVNEPQEPELDNKCEHPKMPVADYCSWNPDNETITYCIAAEADGACLDEEEAISSGWVYALIEPCSHCRPFARRTSVSDFEDSCCYGVGMLNFGR